MIAFVLLVLALLPEGPAANHAYFHTEAECQSALNVVKQKAIAAGITDADFKCVKLETGKLS